MIKRIAALALKPGNELLGSGILKLLIDSRTNTFFLSGRRDS